MKKGLFLLLILLSLLAACTDSPTEPGVPGGGGGSTSGYTVTLTPNTGSAFITGAGAIPGDTEIIELTATVRKDGAVYPDRARVVFEILGTGAAFVESATAYYNTYTVNGAAVAHLYSTATGTFTVKATAAINDNTSANTTKNYTFFEDPQLSVTGVNPVTGSSIGGETVTITGTGFMQPLEVYFGTERAQFVTGTSTEMTVTTPIHYPSACNTNDVVDVRVVLFPGQTAETADSLANAFTFLFEPLEPTVTGVDPNHGDTDGGTLVTVYGSNFYCGGTGVLVYFNDVSAPVVSCAPDRLVVKAPPAHDVGIDNCLEAVSIRVLNLCGGLSYSLDGSFRYGPEIQITAWGPTQGPSTGGTQLIIYGQGFDSPVAVTVAGVGASVTSVSNNELMVFTGVYDPQGRCGNQSGPIAVTDIECGTSAQTDSDAFTYIVPELFIAGISPTEGDDTTLLTINGQGMIPNLEVLFGDTNGIVTSVSADYTSINVDVPLFTGPYDTLPCVTASGCPGEQAQPTPVDVTARSLFTGCEYTFKSFFYLPPEDPLNPGSGVAACVPELPDCSVTASAGTCSVTYTVEPVCGGTYVWTNSSGGACVGQGTTTYTCTYVTSGTKAASVAVTDEVGQGNACGNSADVAVAAACP